MAHMLPVCKRLGQRHLETLANFGLSFILRSGAMGLYTTLLIWSHGLKPMDGKARALIL